MKATVDESLCTGCELCVGSCPEVFGMDDSGVAKVKADPVPEAQEESCRNAASGCPVEAITIME